MKYCPSPYPSKECHLAPGSKAKYLTSCAISAVFPSSHFLPFTTGGTNGRRYLQFLRTALRASMTVSTQSFHNNLPASPSCIFALMSRAANNG